MFLYINQKYAHYIRSKNPCGARSALGATDDARRHKCDACCYLGRDDAPRCPSRSKAKVNCFLHALPTAICGYVGDHKGGGIPPEQNTAALNDGAKVR